MKDKKIEIEIMNGMFNPVIITESTITKDAIVIHQNDQDVEDADYIEIGLSDIDALIKALNEAKKLFSGE